MHNWFKYCIDVDVYEHPRTLKSFIGVLRKQSNTDKSLIPYRESVRLNDYDDDGEFIGKLKAPRYFGAGFEAFSETVLEVFGHEFNMVNVRSLDGIEYDQEDTGYDMVAKTAKEKIYKGNIKKKAYIGSPVYIQVKATFNPTREFTTNDGSRIMNFYANAQSHSRMLGNAYQARYILITSAKGLHYKLENNTHKDIEVINFKKISRLVKDNPMFWNAFRQKLGLAEIPFSSRSDPEFECISKEIINNENKPLQTQ